MQVVFAFHHENRVSPFGHTAHERNGKLRHHHEKPRFHGGAFR